MDIRKVISIAALALGGCGIGPAYPDTGRPNFTDYSFVATATTPGGIEIDDPQHQLNIAELDATVANVVSCLSQFKDAPMTEAEKTEYTCFGTADLTLKYGLRVMVPADWHVSACTGYEIFPCKVPDASCEEKGMTPTTSCPCSCRAMIQDNSIIVTAPNLQLFPAQLAQLLTGCEQPWHPGRLLACVQPSLRAQ